MPDPIFLSGCEQRLPRVIPVVVVLIRMRRLGGELVARVDDAAAGGAIAHRIVGERLRRS